KKNSIRKMMDSGADIFLGRRLESIDKEMYKNKLICYSLGDFISDNKKSSGELLGVVYNKKKITLYPFPLTVSDGYPEYTRVP
ncbi:MAG: CapA family protein, partial [bacterium]|nr:CapA family protein [bacterium]